MPLIIAATILITLPILLYLKLHKTTLAMAVLVLFISHLDKWKKYPTEVSLATKLWGVVAVGVLIITLFIFGLIIY